MASNSQRQRWIRAFLSVSWSRAIRPKAVSSRLVFAGSNPDTILIDDTSIADPLPAVTSWINLSRKANFAVEG